MAVVQTIPLPYQKDSTHLFSKIAHLPGSVFLDSCAHYSASRYDIIAALPQTLLKTIGDETSIQTSEKHWISYENPFSLLKNFVHHNIELDANLPFVGGAIGYFAYDLARRFERLPNTIIDDIAIPQMIVGIYDWAIIVDHHQQATYLVVHNPKPSTAIQELIQNVLNLLEKPPQVHADFCTHTEVNSDISYEAYATAFNKILQYLHNGDCYQVNLSQRFSAEYSGSSWNAYQKLRQHNPAPFSAYLNFQPAAILSLSPERFLLSSKGQVETKPIKGTRPRDPHNAAQDKKLWQELLADPKERAENLMIVDLLRNDLGKSCQIGSIQVPNLFAIESFPAVHHLVSTITGRIIANKHNADLLQGCFPGGSITGAPKLRAMEIIEEVEQYRRNVYCGAIGYLSHNGNMDTNIAIRTLIADESKLYCNAGGAITADSKLDLEYQECFDKLSMILKCLNACRVDT